MGEIQNPVVQTVDKIIQVLLYDLGVNAAVVAITTQVPFLGLPFFKQMTTWIVKQVANILYKNLEQFVAFQIIDFQTGAQADAYLEAVNKLTMAQAKGDEIEINKAVDEFKEKLTDLVRLRPIK